MSQKEAIQMIREVLMARAQDSLRDDALAALDSLAVETSEDALEFATYLDEGDFYYEPYSDEWVMDVVKVAREIAARDERIRLKYETEIMRLKLELEYIAFVKPETWREDVKGQFQQWAQNRARAALMLAERNKE